MDLQRPKRSADEIAALPPAGTTDWEIHVRANARIFSAESLVHVLRQAADIKNTVLFESVGRVLTGLPDHEGHWRGGHCESIIRSVAVARSLNADPQVLHEFREHCHLAMWRAVLKGWKKKPYWELRFGLVLKRVCIDEARKFVRALQHLAPLSDDILNDHEESVDEECWQREVNQATEAAVRRLPPRLGQAGFLAIVLELPIDSKEGDSVAKVLGITPRWAYELVGRAKARLAADPQLRKLTGRDSP